MACVLLVGCIASPARAAGDPDPFVAVATISACGGDTLTIAAEIKPTPGKEAKKARKRALRKVRRAKLNVRFEAAPLYGDTTKTDEVDLGKGKRGRRFERFSDLPANTYSGVVRYRWKRGKKTVLSGVMRTTKAKAAGRRGKAYCSLPTGRAPKDTRPPFVIPIPYDGAWKRGPLDVLFYAVDDLSGVSGVFWRLDGGSFNLGRAMKIRTEGQHTLQYLARDVAGNQSKLTAITLRVDLNPPTVPTIAAPSGSTTDSTPDITWAKSTDSASGVGAYYVLVRNSSDAIVFGQPVTAATTTLTVSEALPAGQYTAQVIAVDRASPQPFTSVAASLFSIVDPATAARADSDGAG